MTGVFARVVVAGLVALALDVVDLAGVLLVKVVLTGAFLTEVVLTGAFFTEVVLAGAFLTVLAFALVAFEEEGFAAVAVAFFFFAAAAFAAAALRARNVAALARVGRSGRFQSGALSARKLTGMVRMPPGSSITASAAASDRSFRTSEITVLGAWLARHARDS